MKSSDVMVRKVIRPIRRLLYPKLRNHWPITISAHPVIDDGGRVISVISEADLMRRKEVGSKVPGAPILIGRLEAFQRLGELSPRVTPVLEHHGERLFVCGRCEKEPPQDLNDDLVERARFLERCIALVTIVISASGETVTPGPMAVTALPLY
jgi:hypothetical protein